MDDPSRASGRLLPLVEGSSLVSAVLCVATTFLPWASSGDRTRSSYAIVAVVERAGVLPSSTARLSDLWYLVPVLGGLALASAALGSVRVVALATGTLGVTVVTGGVLVARSPLVVEPGLILGTAIGVATACTGIGTFIMRRRS